MQQGQGRHGESVYENILIKLVLLGQLENFRTYSGFALSGWRLIKCDLEHGVWLGMFFAFEVVVGSLDRNLFQFHRFYRVGGQRVTRVDAEFVARDDEGARHELLAEAWVVSEQLNREKLALFRMRQERRIEWPRLVMRVWVLLGQYSFVVRFPRRLVTAESKWLEMLNLGLGNLQRRWLNRRADFRGRVLLQQNKSSALAGVELNALLLALLNRGLREQTVLRN